MTMLSNLPTVDVIVPVYNGEKTIAACLESLLKQNYPADRYRIVVVENGSTDRTSGVVQVYPVCLLHSPQRGPAAARNYGIGQSKAQIIAFTDADCVAGADWLVELVKPYQDDSIGGVGGTILARPHDRRNTIELFSEQSAPLVNFLSGAGEFLPHLYTANASYRRSILNQAGGFNPDFYTGEDVDLSWRVQLQTGAKLAFAKDAVVYHQHRTTQAGLARQYRQYGYGEIVLDTLYGKYPGYPRTRGFQIRRILSQVLALPRYLLSIVLRRLRYRSGKLTLEEAAMPKLWLLVESSNIRGKLEAIWATRFMSQVEGAWLQSSETYIRRFY